MKTTKQIFFLTLLTLSFLIGPKILAADLYLLSETKNLGINQNFTVDIIINSDGPSINATQAVIHFPNNILELTSVDQTRSIFNFWVEEPTISNEAGTLSFIGGTPRGVSGTSLKVLRMNFKAIGTGVATLSLSDTAIIASDGKGTNVLYNALGINVAVGTNIIEPEAVFIPEPIEDLEVVPIELPIKIEREPIAVTGAPIAPVIRVPLYPDQAEWYNQLGEIIALWDVPEDIIQVATKLEQTKTAEPGDKQNELFTGQTFGILEEGVWYIRAQFRNNNGWGDLSHYQISLDTTPPLPFNIEMDNPVSDEPKPEIRFQTQDSFSGVSKALIFVDNTQVQDLSLATSTDINIKLPVQDPGEHIARVKIFDKAGNSVEDSIEFEVLPLPLPEIESLTQKIHTEENILITGHSIPRAIITLLINNSQGQEVVTQQVETDLEGHFSTILGSTLKPGHYTIRLFVNDDRGAQSLTTQPLKVKIQAKIILSIGLIDVTWISVVLTIFLILIIAVISSILTYTLQQRKKQAYSIIIARDIDKLTTLLNNDIKELEAKTGDSLSPKAKIETELYFKKIKTTIAKMKKYLIQDINKLK